MLVRPEVLRQLLLFQPFQQRVERPSLDAREPVPAKRLGNGVPVILPWLSTESTACGSAALVSSG